MTTDRCAGCEALEQRVNLLELAVAELGRRGREPAPTNERTVFGISVYLAPDVDQAAILAAVDELPAGLGADDAVDRLQGAGLLVRKSPRR